MEATPIVVNVTIAIMQLYPMDSGIPTTKLLQTQLPIKNIGGKGDTPCWCVEM